MRCIDALTLLMMAEHHPRHAVRVLVRSIAQSDYIAHAKCAHKLGCDVAIPEPGDPPTHRSVGYCPLCKCPTRIWWMHEHNEFRFEDPLPCDFWTR